MFASVTSYSAPPAQTASVTREASVSLIGLYGQPEADAAIRDYLTTPHSCAFLLSGPPGTGKTTTAQFLCDHLGVDRSPIGGYEEIASGKMNAESVTDLSRRLRLRPMAGFWRLIVVNEADLMSRAAEGIWLDILDPHSDAFLPQNCTVVFTTNNPEKLSQRFCERCTEITYSADESAVREFALAEWQRLAPGRPIPPAVRNAGYRAGRSPSYRLAAKEVRQALARIA